MVQTIKILVTKSATEGVNVNGTAVDLSRYKK